MKKRNLQILLKDLEFLILELKSEIYSDPESYIHNCEHTGVGRYIDNNDDDGDPD